MGVPGLWDELNPGGKSRSFSALCVAEGFEKNPMGRRAYRLGVDASIWYQHAATSKGQGDTGDNPELRNIFFKLENLAKHYVLPIFVFDGRERAGQKRNSKKGKAGSHYLTDGMKELIDASGWLYVMARGEAEAELAQMNAAGDIDAILTDDCDAFLFGARTIIKNLSLSGNKTNPAVDKNGKASKEHVNIYTAANIQTQTGLSRGGMILFALLSGGDYDKGISGCGAKIGLAQLGYGDELLRAFERRGDQNIAAFLPQWRTRMNSEINTNASGKLGRRSTSLTLPSTFPDLTILENYANPVRHAHSSFCGDKGEMKIAKVAAFCEKNFSEWGTKTLIITRFRTLMWSGAVTRVLRRAAIKADEKEKEKRLFAGNHDSRITGALRPSRQEAEGTPASLVQGFLTAGTSNVDDAEARRNNAFVNQGSSSQSQARFVPDTHPLISKIVGTRRHISTDELLEYRVEVCPIQLVQLALKGIKGTRQDDGRTCMKGATVKEKEPPDSMMRLWVPSVVMHQVHPGLVENYAMAEWETEGDCEDSCLLRKGFHRPQPKAQPRASASASTPVPHASSPNIHLTNPDVSDYNTVPVVGWSPSDMLENDALFMYTFPDPHHGGDNEDDDDICFGDGAEVEDRDSEVEIVGLTLSSSPRSRPKPSPPKEQSWEPPFMDFMRSHPQPHASSSTLSQPQASTLHAANDGEFMMIDDDDFGELDGTRAELDMMDVPVESAPSRGAKRSRNDHHGALLGGLFGEEIDERGAMGDQMFQRMMAGRSKKPKKATVAKQKSTRKRASGSAATTARKASNPSAKKASGTRTAQQPLFLPGTPPTSQTSIEDDPDVFVL